MKLIYPEKLKLRKITLIQGVEYDFSRDGCILSKNEMECLECSPHIENRWGKSKNRVFVKQGKALYKLSWY